MKDLNPFGNRRTNLNTNVSSILENEKEFSKSGSSHILVFTAILRFCKSSHIHFSR